jgi:MoxR-like ATPase
MNDPVASADDQAPGPRRYFDPTQAEAPGIDEALRGGDRPDKSPYAYTDEIVLAVNAALAANRPLLVAGPPGTGKSALAVDIAKQLDQRDAVGWIFDQQVITGRTEGRELLWRFDTVRRLHDAQLAAARGAERTANRPEDPADPLPPVDYREKAVLWRAFEASADAEHRKRTVVLIDEIDKADADVPNSLLEVLGSGRFRCDETGEVVEVDDDFAPFIVITTNDERELPRPFRRRCVTLTLRAPDAERLLEIAEAQGLTDTEAKRMTASEIADWVAPDGVTKTARSDLSPNAAEYLDAVRAAINLDIDVQDPAWRGVAEATLVKSLASDRART